MTSSRGGAPTARVSVCVATFRRPEGLERLLRALGCLQFRKVPRPEVELVVVDNDPAAAGHEVCERLRPELPWPLRYAHETRRGISFSRNRAVAEADARSDFIAYLDDDEVPEPQWLDELLHTQAEHNADLVGGPVEPLYDDGVPAWVRQQGFIGLKRYPTGARIEHTGTGNLLVRAEILRGLEEPFDPRLALSGGEDTHFFFRIAGAGHTMIWSDEAMVRENVPVTRTEARWILQRAYRYGNTWSLCEREFRSSPRTIGLRIAKGAARIGLGLASLPLAVVKGRPALIRSAWQMAVGAGNLTGLVGHRYQEYQTTHGG